MFWTDLVAMAGLVPQPAPAVVQLGVGSQSAPDQRRGYPRGHPGEGQSHRRAKPASQYLEQAHKRRARGHRRHPGHINHHLPGQVLLTATDAAQPACGPGHQQRQRTGHGRDVLGGERELDARSRTLAATPRRRATGCARYTTSTCPRRSPEQLWHRPRPRPGRSSRRDWRQEGRRWGAGGHRTLPFSRQRVAPSNRLNHPVRRGRCAQTTT